MVGNSNILNASANIIEITAKNDFGILIGAIITLAAAMIAAHIFTITTKSRLNKIEKEFLGNEFIKELKKKLMFDYKFWMKASFGFMIFSIIIYLYILYKLGSIIYQWQGFNAEYNFAGPIFLTIATAVISVFITILVYCNKSKIEDYKNISRIRDLPDVPSNIKTDLERLSKLWQKKGKLRVKSKNLKDQIIQGISSVIEEGKK